MISAVNRFEKVSKTEKKNVGIDEKKKICRVMKVMKSLFLGQNVF